jgi:hypothetical protein
LAFASWRLPLGFVGLYNDDPHPGVCTVTTLLACGLVGLIRLRIR